MAITDGAQIEFWGAHTSRTMRPVWVAEELELDYQLHPIGPRTGETQTDAYTEILRTSTAKVRWLWTLVSNTWRGTSMSSNAIWKEGNTFWTGVLA